MVDYKCKKCGKSVTNLDEIKHKDLIELELCGLCGYYQFIKDNYPEFNKPAKP